MKKKLAIITSILTVILLFGFLFVWYEYSGLNIAKAKLQEQQESLKKDKTKFEKEQEKYKKELKDFKENKKKLKKEKEEFEKAEEAVAIQNPSNQSNNPDNSTTLPNNMETQNNTDTEPDEVAQVDEVQNTENEQVQETSPTDAEEQQIYVRISEIDLEIKRMKSMQARYPTHAKEYREALEEEIRFTKEKKALLQRLMELKS